MRLRISHSTTYTYDPPPTGIVQVLRLTPGNHDGQYVADWHLDVSVDARLAMRHDAFGNITHVFNHGPLSELTVQVSGMVETQDTSGVLKGTVERFPPSFFLRSTPLTDPDAEMLALSRALFEEAGGKPLDFLHALMTEINRTMTFDTHATSATTSAVEAFGIKRGVCQDFTHIFTACARGAGVPARYVSGHFYSSEGGLTQPAGHAWAEAFVPDLGWVGFDAANGIGVTDAHIRVAIGLDYLGAAPVRGTRYGGGNEALSVAVEVDQAGRQSQS